jgi:alpha-1,2-mannosyltransferase
MTLLFILLSLLVAAIVSVLFFLRTLHRAAEILGRRLRRSSKTRRELLLARVARESRHLEAGHRKTKEDDDWENIGASPLGSTTNGAKADTEWKGIVGFFHPFW